MTFIEKIEKDISSGQLKASFTIQELNNKNYSPNEIKNISNHCLENTGSSNKNKKILIRTVVKGVTYYKLAEIDNFI